MAENVECLKERLISSQNPFINEFNLVYKDVVQRLPIFEKITSGQSLTSQFFSNGSEWGERESQDGLAVLDNEQDQQTDLCNNLNQMFEHNFRD